MKTIIPRNKLNKIDLVASRKTSGCYTSKSSANRKKLCNIRAMAKLANVKGRPLTRREYSQFVMNK